MSPVDRVRKALCVEPATASELAARLGMDFGRLYTCLVLLELRKQARIARGKRTGKITGWVKSEPEVA